MAIAVVTGGSRGLGLALAQALAERGWTLVLDARDAQALAAAEQAIREHTTPGASVVAIAGDVADAEHRGALVAAAARLGGLDLVVNNASTLGATPLPNLVAYPLADLARRPRGQRRGPPGAGAGSHAPVALVAPARRAQRHVGCLGRALRGMGRLRLVQGGARPPERGLGRRGTRPSWCGPSTPVTCGPRCTRTRSPARTSPTGRRRPTSCRIWWRSSRRDSPAEGTGCRSSQHPAEPRHRRCRRDDARLPQGSCHRGPPRLRAPPRARGGLASRGPGHDEGRRAHARGPPARRHARALPFLRAAALHRGRRPDRRQHLGNPRRGRGGHRLGRSTARGAFLHAAPRQPVDRRAAPW